MAKYLKLFKADADYQQFIGGEDFLMPNVSLVTDTNSLFYNPLEKELPYLTITALEDDLTVSFTKSCQYSLNGTEWNGLSANTETPAINTGEKIYFKAELVQSMMKGIGTFTVSKPFNLSGTVMSMLFGDEVEGKTDLTGVKYNTCFMSLFENSPVVNISPKFLPATKLENACYNSMFYGCTSLVTAPELPATTLADGCYSYMFEGCTSLVNAPELPATTLAETCYYNMFYGCTSLVTTPNLPANILAHNCYGNMFQGCTSLVNAPELPATTLTTMCYNGMFQGCTSLVNAPELPATTLTNYCYKQMFDGCTSLNYIKMLATDISATSCLYRWVSNVSPTGTFVKSKDATWNVTGVSGIPEGWTVETV